MLIRKLFIAFAPVNFMASSAWLFIIAVIVIVFVFMKVASKKQEIAVKLAFVIFMILILTIGYVFVKTDPQLNEPVGIVGFGKTYFLWIGSIFTNLKILSTNAVNLEWEADNETSGNS